MTDRDPFTFDDDPPDASPDDAFLRPAARWAPAVLLVGALTGLFFAGRSTADFVAHLDRDVHAIHCGISPTAQAEVGESGCRTVMLSPYSSFFREDLWGGLPVSLWAIAVFAFLAYRAAHLTLRGRPRKDEGVFLLCATLLPVLMSAIYAHIAVNKVGAVCATCAGIYVASGLSLLGAILTLVVARPQPEDPVLPRRSPAVGFAFGVGEGVAFVAALTVVYLAFTPEAGAGRGPGGCGVLAAPEDPAGIILPLSPVPGGAQAIEVLDPLCPSCRAFDTRLKASGLDAKLDHRAVLFPLDAECNWMLQTSLHPGACAVSEAMLCAPADAKRVLAWAFQHQEALLAEAKGDPKKLRERIAHEFPAVAGCVGSAQARNKVNKSLRWAVANALPVLTPQLFVNGRRMCDEDTDLGLEYTLSRMLK